MGLCESSSFIFCVMVWCMRGLWRCGGMWVRLSIFLIVFYVYGWVLLVIYVKFGSVVFEVY